MSSLSLRQPASVWIAGALLSATLAHGLCWVVVLMIVGRPTFTEVQGQIVLSLFWMTGALIMWRLMGAPSRLHAIFTVLGCALFVSVAGSVAAFARLHFFERIELDPGFMMFSALWALAHLFISVPSAFVLQQLALSRASKPAPDPA